MIEWFDDLKVGMRFKKRRGDDVQRGHQALRG